MKMKSAEFILLGVACCALQGTVLPLAAMPVGGSSISREYLVSLDPLERWSFGVYGESGKRDVEVKNMATRLETTKLMAYVGYDVLPWVNVYVTAGTADTEFRQSDSGSGNAEFGLGTRLNLIDHEILEPALTENRVQLSAECLLTTTQAEWYGEDMDLNKLAASMTVSIVNDLDNSRSFQPAAIALFAGPLYSGFVSGDVEEDDQFGFTAGCQIFFNEKVIMNVGVESLDDLTWVAGLHLRF